MSQSPDLLQLQKRCYQQLNANKQMPKNADSIESQAEELKLVCNRRTVLLCLGELSIPYIVPSFLYMANLQMICGTALTSAPSLV